MMHLGRARIRERGFALSRPMVVAAAVAIAAVVAGAFGLIALRRALEPPPSETETFTLHPTATLLTAVRDLARLETTELHMEKVVDLTDKQSRFFGLIEATDAILLVAAGDVTLGVDLGKVSESDVTTEGPDGGTLRITLPEPEIFAVRLDEERTYVYTRATSLLARRNEHLEERARKEAVAAIEKAARDSDATERAKRQAERQLGALLGRMSGRAVEVAWH